MPCLGRFWLSDSKFLILTKNDGDEVNCVVYDIETQTQAKAHELCDLIQINEAGQPSILTSKPKDDKINIVIPEANDIHVFRLDAAKADNDTELVATIELDEELGNR